jgi:SagB-type dehydrogenase family enzyme
VEPTPVGAPPPGAPSDPQVLPRASENAARIAAVFTNSYRAIHHTVGATGFRTHGLRYRSLEETPSVALATDYLVNSRYLKHDRETEESIRSYFLDPGIFLLASIGEEDVSGLSEIRLPEGVKLRREFGQVLSDRRSRRSYTGDRIELSYLATLIRAASAITATANVPRADRGHARFAFRTAPSGGGLYPIDLYVASVRAERVPRGVYRYDPRRDALLAVAPEAALDRVLAAIAVPEEIIAVSRCAAVLLLVGHPWRAMRKYGARALRFLFIEAGAIAQNVHLACAAVGLASVDCASVFDDAVHDALELDGVNQVLVHAVVLGQPG